MNLWAWSAIFIFLSIFTIAIIIFVSYLKRVVEDCLTNVKEVKQQQEVLNEIVKENIKELTNILKRHI